MSTDKMFVEIRTERQRDEFKPSEPRQEIRERDFLLGYDGGEYRAEEVDAWTKPVVKRLLSLKREEVKRQMAELDQKIKEA